MAAFDLYGFLGTDLDYAKRLLELRFSLEFCGHDSNYHGQYFRCGDSNSEHFILKPNLDLFDREPLEPTFHMYQILLYVNNTLRSHALQQNIESLEDFHLLRHEVLS